MFIHDIFKSFPVNASKSKNTKWMMNWKKDPGSQGHPKMNYHQHQ